MDSVRFDALTRWLEATRSRRGMLGLVGGLAVANLPGLAEVGTGKKKKHRCRTVGGPVLCPKKRICCSPTGSTGPGCAPKGFPICCLAAGFAYPAGTTCCDAADEGDDGVCQDPEFPNCCQASIGGCCEDGFPVCCDDPASEAYCCPSGSTCCPETESGCCETLTHADRVGGEASSHAARRGQHRSQGRRVRRRAFAATV